jgi:hypothetical protein
MALQVLLRASVRLLLLAVCLGYGIVRPDLSRKEKVSSSQRKFRQSNDTAAALNSVLHQPLCQYLYYYAAAATDRRLNQYD